MFIVLGFSRDSITEIGRKDTIIFFNRCYNIEKLTPRTLKKPFSRRKKGKKVGKKTG
jgi:hypothetical protein